MSIISFVELFKTELWTLISDMLICCAFIAIVSSLFTEAVKITVKKVFRKKRSGSIFAWIVNALTICTLSILFVLLFNKKSSLILNSLYIILICFISWIISIITYSFVTKLVFISMNTVYNIAKNHLMQSDVALLKSTILKEKNQELLANKLLINDLQENKMDYKYLEMGEAS